MMELALIRNMEQHQALLQTWRDGKELFEQIWGKLSL